MERVSKKQNLPLLIVGGLVLVLFVVVVGSFVSKQYAGNRELKRLQDELTKQEGVLDTQRRLLVEAKYRQEEFIEKAKQYLYLDEQSNIADIAKVIEQTAADYEVKLNSISEVKNQFKTDDGSSILEFAIVSAGCSYEKAIRFLAAIRNMSPNLGWQHVQLAYNERLDEDARVIIAGTLRVVAINNDKIRGLLGEAIPKLVLNVKAPKSEISEEIEDGATADATAETTEESADATAETTEESAASDATAETMEESASTTEGEAETSSESNLTEGEKDESKPLQEEASASEVEAKEEPSSDDVKEEKEAV